MSAASPALPFKLFSVFSRFDFSYICATLVIQTVFQGGSAHSDALAQLGLDPSTTEGRSQLAYYILTCVCVAFLKVSFGSLGWP